ncbi:MAG: hypothetical protein IKO12_06900 [Bacteroidaceae bacterium]|nr:hypothetical protein [Bacteroidaceae bacterium]
MKRIIRILAIALLSTSLTAGNLFKGRFKNIENQLNLHIDLYEESLSVPGLEMFGPMHGYVNGQGVYNVWYITKVELKGEDKAVIRVSNDLGSEAQAIELTFLNDSTLHFKQIEGNVIKKVVGKKLQKIPVEMTLQRVKK